MRSVADFRAILLLFIFAVAGSQAEANNVPYKFPWSFAVPVPVDADLASVATDGNGTFCIAGWAGPSTDGWFIIISTTNYDFSNWETTLRHKVPQAVAPYEPPQIVWGPHGFVAIQQGFTPYSNRSRATGAVISVSLDGIHWQTTEVPTKQSSNVRYGGNMYLTPEVELYNKNKVKQEIWYSRDGLDWARTKVPAPGEAGECTDFWYFKGHWWTFRDNDVWSTPNPNTVAWTHRSNVSDPAYPHQPPSWASIEFTELSNSGLIVMAVNFSTGPEATWNLWFSADGLKWKHVVNLGWTTGGPWSVACNGDHCLANLPQPFFQDGPYTPYMWVSVDGGQSWAPGTTPALAVPLHSVDGVFFALGADTYLVYSVDGTQWEYHECGPTGPTTNPLFVKTQYVVGTHPALAGREQGGLYTSPDGRKWQRRLSAAVDGIGIDKSPSKKSTLAVAVLTTAPGGMGPVTTDSILAVDTNTWETCAVATPSMGEDANYVNFAIGNNTWMVDTYKCDQRPPRKCTHMIALTRAAVECVNGQFKGIGRNTNSSWQSSYSYNGPTVYDYVNGQWVQIQCLGGPQLYISKDNGRQWTNTEIYANTCDPWTCKLVFENGMYFSNCLNQGGMLEWSTDALHWSSTGVEASGHEFGHVSYLATALSGYHYFTLGVRDNSTTKLHASVDGKTWLQEDFGFPRLAESITWMATNGLSAIARTSLSDILITEVLHQ